MLRLELIGVELEGLVPYAPNAVISISYEQTFLSCNEYVTKIPILKSGSPALAKHGLFSMQN